MSQAPLQPTQALLVRIAPTRVRRNYRGGRMLDTLEGAAAPIDSDKPESWIASTVEASNPGMPTVDHEGLTRVTLEDGQVTHLRSLLATAPEHFLGKSHAAALGTQLGFLAKLLDSSMRLHVQAHPTSAFAREHLNSPYGKLEVYYVLAVREGVEGYIRLGFQKAPTQAEWKRIIEEQDIPAMDASFEKIPVKQGDVWIVPGGMPHAIGEGVLMVEVMEPSDLVVRCEFEREGVVVPPGGRFMGRGIDFCLQIFDYNAYTPEQVRGKSKLEPARLEEKDGWKFDRLVGNERTSCFEVFRIQASKLGSLQNDGRCALIIQTKGETSLCSGGQKLSLRFGECAFLAAAAQAIEVCPGDQEAELILCRPSKQL